MAKSKNHSNSNEYIWKDDQLIPKDVCFDCGSYNQINYHHVVPESKGGKRTIPLCIECHGKVHGRNFLNHKELQRIGIERAKREGRFLGRKVGTIEDDFKFLSKDKNMRIINLLIEGISYSKISKQVNVSTTTITKVNKAYQNFNEKDKLDLVGFKQRMKEKDELIGKKFELDDWMKEI
jgi:uncharacterized protein YerC